MIVRLDDEMFLLPNGRICHQQLILRGAVSRRAVISYRATLPDVMECPQCKRIMAKDPDSTQLLLTVDHIIPRKHGGTNQRSNLRPMCVQCNNKLDKFNQNITWLKKYNKLVHRRNLWKNIKSTYPEKESTQI